MSEHLFIGGSQDGKKQYVPFSQTYLEFVGPDLKMELYKRELFVAQGNGEDVTFSIFILYRYTAAQAMQLMIDGYLVPQHPERMEGV
jgi:hypothetical protein